LAELIFLSYFIRTCWKLSPKNQTFIETNGSNLYFFIVFRQMATFSHTLDLYYISVRGQPAIILQLHTHNKNAVKFIGW